MKQESWEVVWLDERFQAACQRYAREGGTSEAIAKAAVAAMPGEADSEFQQGGEVK